MMFLTLGATSCEKEVDPSKLVSVGNKLVVNSIISPQLEWIEVEVSRSRPILGTRDDSNDDYITTATVLISNGNEKLNLIYNSTSRKYELPTSQMPIIEGKSYQLTVTDKTETVTAKCLIPSSVDQVQVNAADSYGNGGYTIKIDWQDFPIADSYFYYAYSYTVENLERWTLVLSEENLGTSQNNETGKMSISDYLQISLSRTPSSNISRKLKFRLLSVDENYYRYQKQLSELVEEGPFTEATQIFSNIEGGLGFFGAYSETNRVFDFK